MKSSSSEERNDPYISLELGKHGQTEISVHQYYPTVDYKVLVPYEGNPYPFPYPELHNYSGQYYFELSDSENVVIEGAGDGTSIKLKYDFGGFFHLKAIGENDSEIASLYLQAQTSHLGKGEFVVVSGEDILTKDSSLTMDIGDNLSLNASFNGKKVNNVFSSSDSAVLSVSGNSVQAVGAGDANLIVTFSQTDASETAYDYSFVVPVHVNRNDLLDSLCLSSGDEIYFINSEIKYNGYFYALYQNGSTKTLTDEDLEFELGEESEGKRQVTVSYSEDGITKTASFEAPIYSASKGTSTSMGYDFRDYYECYGTGMRSVRSTGTVNFLVIPVWFTNSTSWFNESQKEQMLEDIQERMFGDGTNGPSVKSYYETESKGKVTITGTVAPWFDDTYASSRYNDYLNDGYPGELGKRAINDYFASHTDDSLANYDRDNDQKLDGLIIFYAANYYGVYENNRSNAFASHYYNSGSGANEKLNNLIFSPLGEMYGFSGKTVSNRQKNATDLSAVNPELYKYGSRVTIHEVGHFFGAEDLYYSGGAWHNTSSETPYYPAGSFSMQDNNLGGHDPFSVNAYGWGEPVVYDSSNYAVGDYVDVYLDDFQSSASSLILTNSWNEENSPFDEYLNLELYSPSMLNEHDAENSSTAAKQLGLRLWHVDAELELHNNGQVGYFPKQMGTSFIASNLYDTDEGYHLVHQIRNDESETYRPTSTFSDESLFHAGDDFSMIDFASQFKNEGFLDDGSKLGWEFEAKALFGNGDGTYGAVIRLTRVDSTITEFSKTLDLANPAVGELQTNAEIADQFGLDPEIISIKAVGNGSSAPRIGWEYPDHYLALEINQKILFELKQQQGCQCLIKKIYLSFRMNTTYTHRGVPTMYAGGQQLTPTSHNSYSGKTADDPGYMSITYEFDVNALSAYAINENVNSYPVWLTEIVIEYSIIPNHLLP